MAVRKLFVIGIGTGDPDQITVQAIKAVNQAEVFFVMGKGAEKRELVQVRSAILREHMTRPYTVVEIPDPPRDRRPADYVGAVEEWHDRRAQVLENEFVAIGETTAALLVWGDPSLYDSTLRVVERVLDRAWISFDYEVVPGITAPQTLAARHKIVLNQVGEPVHITTGRRLRHGLPRGVRDAVVMLDADDSFRELPADTEIWWAAYLGMPDETLLHGTVGAVGAQISAARAELRERKGWIFDTYAVRLR